MSNRELFDSEFDDLIRKVEEKIPETNLPDLPYMKEAPDVHDWYMFEHEIWAIGEEIRQLTVKYKIKFSALRYQFSVYFCIFVVSNQK